MNKLRYIALALCAVMALGLICGCNDTKPAGTDSDGVSSEDSILSKTGKLSEDEMKLIASDRLTKCNDLMHFLTVDCYDKYTDRSQGVTISSVDYYKVEPDGKYNFHNLSDLYTYNALSIGVSFYYCKCIDLISTSFPLKMETDDGEVLYSSGGLSPAFVDYNDELYATKPKVALKEKYKIDDIKLVDKFDNMFSVEVPVVNVDNESLIRNDIIIFNEYERGYYILSTVESGAELTNKISDDEMVEVAKHLISEYNKLDQFKMMADALYSSKDELLPYSNGDYQKVISTEEYNILSAKSLKDYANSILTADSAIEYINQDIFDGTCPVAFVDSKGTTILTADQSIIGKYFVEYNGSLYVRNCRGNSNDSYYSAENAKIVSKGKNFFFADIEICSHSPGYPPATSTKLFILTKDGYRFVG